MNYYSNIYNKIPEINKYTYLKETIVSKRIIIFWLSGMLALIPVKIFHLPLNMEFVDVWVISGIPVFWVSFILSGKTKINMLYTLAFILILIGSFASIFGAVDQSKSMIVIFKEIYLFIWFITATILFCVLDKDNLRRISMFWAIVVCLHGLFIITQFLIPEIWKMTTRYAGQATNYINYRPSGLIISAKAGDANKAAFFQLLGFVPLIVSRPAKPVAISMGVLLLASILATGSMGTTLALIAGVLAAIIIISIFDHFKFIKKYLLKILFITAVFLGVGLIILYQNDKYKEHFEKIITGRAEKSSGGRFYLWERGIDAFKEHNVFLWGVGPENFREVDPTGNDNQLHNDILAFTVERGLIGVAGLFLFVGTALGRAIFLLLTYNKYPKETGQYVFVFLAGLISVLIVSLTHQIFHARELWIVFALQEAVVYKTNEEIYTASLLK